MDMPKETKPGEHTEADLTIDVGLSEVSVLAKALRDADGVMVGEGGNPAGVIPRHDLLGFLSEGSRRR